jgi:hypothetical protein
MPSSTISNRKFDQIRIRVGAALSQVQASHSPAPLQRYEQLDRIWRPGCAGMMAANANPAQGSPAKLALVSKDAVQPGVQRQGG